MSGRPARRLSGPYAPPVPVRELTVTSADGARLYAQAHGPDGAPAVVLAHGWTCSTAFWAPVVHRLAEDHRVIVYDQRGHGRSPAARPGGCGTGALADDLVAVLETTLADGERAVLAGHSMGGMALMAAADRPRVRAHAAAALLCSTGSSALIARAEVLPLPAGRVRTLLTRTLLGSRAPLGPVTPFAKAVLRYATMGRGAAPVMIEAGARIVHACPRRVRADWGAVLAELDLDAGVANMTMPTAVLQGTVDRLTPIGHARRIAARLPECVGLTELHGLGHMTPLEDPVAVADRIRELVTAYVTARPAGPAGEPGDGLTDGPTDGSTDRPTDAPADASNDDAKERTA
ncbi:alpha/beta fold hydrolase [Streptomyces sp. XD-27]|uniref:alpha/beta fold hydrolase n=1 Tax=Streptomyces sp. XD-27 TaxID=3062779 RepID=UPI0026F46259|nr:alpha/beta fold hydrolase [Streptomyces sp. XD-27]WKX72214.1 alpha/beta fold hydrolase [Streptomyces sp. XD-27]